MNWSEHTCLLNATNKGKDG